MVRLGRHLGKDISGYILYLYRDKNAPDPESDHGSNDDHISIEFNSQKVDNNYIVHEVFPCYVEAFHCYYGTLCDEDIEVDDNPSIEDPKTGRWRRKYTANTRELIIRINAVNYFDRELCRRSFGLTPEVMVERLSGKVEDVRMLGDGVLLVYTYKFLESEELKKVDGEVRKMLGIKSVL